VAEFGLWMVGSWTPARRLGNLVATSQETKTGGQKNAERFGNSDTKARASISWLMPNWTASETYISVFVGTLAWAQ